MADRYWYGGSGTISPSVRWSSKSPALFTASISGTTLTVTAVTGGTIDIGDTIYATGATRGTVTAFGTGSGGIGTYTLSASNTLSSRIMWAVVPSSLLSTDNANFVSTSNNTSYTVTWNTTVLATNLDIAAPSAGTVSISVSSFGTANIAGNFTTAGSGVSVTGTWTVDCTGSSGTITTNGLSLTSTIFKINANAGTYTLGGALTCGELILTLGTFSTSSTSNYALTCGRLTITGTGTRTLNLNASTVSITAATPTAFYAATITNLTFTAGTSQINLSGASSGISSGGLTFNNVSFTSAAASDITITGANTFNTLSFAGRTTVGITPVTFDSNQTITTLTLNAGTAAAYRTFLASYVIGTQRTLTVTTLTAGAADYDFRDIAIAGGAAPIAPTRAGDGKGNSGITFPGAKTVYWMLTGGGNWGTAGTGAWAASSGGGLDATQFPLAQDTAVLNNTSFASNSGKTATVNANYNIGTIDMSALTVGETLATGLTTPAIYGNWINGTGTTLTGTGRMTFAGRTTQQITSAGKTFTQAFTFNTPGGTVTLQDSIACNSSTSPNFNLTSGTFDANGYSVTTTSISGGAGFTSSNSNIRTVNVGSGTWTLAGSGTVWNAATSTNLTVTGTGTISLTSASDKTFAGGSVSYSGITLNQGGAGAMTISGSHTFSNITNTYSATGATTITFTAGTTQTVSSFTATGAVGKILTINSSSAGSAATLSKASGTVSVDYLSVRDSTATGGAAWYAGSNSTNVSGNTGWIFTRPPETINSSVSETSTAVDSIAGSVLFFVNVQETIAAIDQVFAAAAFQSTILETSQAVDTTTVVVSFQTAASETVQAADITSVVASTFGAVNSETAAASETVQGANTGASNVSESAVVAETVQSQAVFVGVSSETALVLESTNAAAVFSTIASETAQAADITSVVASTFGAVNSETAAASDAQSAIASFRGSASESATASETTTVAASTFGATSAETATAQDSVDAPGSTYNPSTSETAQALDTPSAAATFPVATSETATIADQNAAAFTAATNISESATAADITAALAAFAALTAENASASDQNLVATSTFNAIAAAAAQAFDSVDAPGSIYNAAVVNTAVALDSSIGAFLWNLIDDSQGTGWTLISVAATSEPSWASSAASPTALISINYNSNPSSGAGYLLYTGGQTNYYTLPVTGGDNTISSAFYVNGQFFVIGVQYGSGVMLRSVDGRNWTTVTVPNPSSPVLTVFGNGTQLGILNGGSTHISTDNGSTWTTGAAGQATFSYRTDVVWDGAKYVLNDGRRIRTSADGLNWTIRFTTGVGRDRGSLVWTGSAFVAVFSSVISPTTTATTRVSADGVTWNTPTPSFSNAVSLFQGPGLVGLFQKNGSVVALSNITDTNFTTAFLTNVPGYTYYPNDPYGLQVAQLGGLYFVPGVGGVAMTSKYITTTDFQSYAIRVVAGVSPWTGIDDSQTPGWQNINTLN